MKNSDTLCEDVSTFMTAAVAKKVTMAAVDINQHYSALIFFCAIYMVHN
jgi:hypothetical protein